VTYVQMPNADAHRQHKRKANVHHASFAGKRLRTEIMRCTTCGGVLVSLEQTEARRRR
jgi:hypothetical protein